jgi:hypothetical protein
MPGSLAKAGTGPVQRLRGQEDTTPPSPLKAHPEANLDHLDIG